MNAGRSLWWISTICLILTIFAITGLPQLNEKPQMDNAGNICGSGVLLDEELTISLYEPTEEPEIRYQRSNDSKFELPPVNWSINSQGLRDDPIPENKSNNTVRILVIGDSQTEGWGLNTSQRYTDKAEKSLNGSFNANINVINAGIGGQGMKEYYLYLYNEGLDLDPDIVIVPFKASDEISIEEYRQLENRLRDKYNLTNESLTENEDAWEERQKWFNDMSQNQTVNSSNIITYGNMMRNLSNRNKIDFFLFPMRSDISSHLYDSVEIQDRNYQTRMAAWQKRCGMNIIEPPKIRDIGFNSTKFTLKRNYHFNEKANNMLSNKLSGRMKDHLKEDYKLSMIQ